MKYLSKYDEFVLHRSVVMKAHLGIFSFFVGQFRVSIGRKSGACVRAPYLYDLGY